MSSIVLWRGCNHGCLGFLETGNLPPEPTPMHSKGFGPALDENGDEFEFSDEE